MSKPNAFIIFLLLLGGMQAAGAQTSNEETLQTLFNRLAVRADSIIGASRVNALVLKHQSLETPAPQRRLYASLVQICSRNGRVLFAEQDSSTEGNNALAVQYQISALEIRYRKLAKPSWFRGARIERTVRVVTDFDLRESFSRRIFFQGELKEAFVDTLKGKVEKLENAELPFTLGAWQTKESRRSWLEPALLTAATGAMVYAFYSLRSQ